ncbi:zinc ribbon domain-containing protein [Haloarcula sp. S1AR25-5A]|uniref:Zinc ribbon domain-containing protein n=1 Tax=Haloarcula terrestris TaxID=2950533 RepID=A0AAE4F256_9EURY|nr:zinc ribbon domain-containing protein [Haloarcula terrestris]MDS0222931.1 zinc ribbon domain-containing protein [Haloarcula terrestris]
MERGRLGSELRESAALLRAETWLFVGMGLAWVAYGGWVIATGRVLGVLGVDGPVFSTGIPLSLRTVLAVGLWLVGPGLVSVVLINRRLRNRHGNLVAAYRLDHPSLLLAIPGCVLLGSLLLRVILGQWLPLTVLAVVGSVHLVVRTVAYGHRVYTLSFLPILSVLVFLSAVSFGVAWLVHATTAPGVSAALSPWIADAGVGPVVETMLRLIGIPAAQAGAVFIAVPGVLASVYLLVQLLTGAVVRARAPLANPQRRPDQRFPIMPPVDSPRDADETAVVERAVDTDSREQSVDKTDTADEADDDATPAHTGTRVFSPDEVAQTHPPAHESTQGDGQSPADATAEPTAVEGGTDTEGSTAKTDESDADDAAKADAEEDAADEEWIDDTAVFTPGGRDDGPSYCGECGESLPPAADTCPSCGDAMDR